MRRFTAITIIAAATLWESTIPQAKAVSAEQVKAFLQSVGCSQLPTGTCEALSATNAKNILTTYFSQLSNAYCGSGNFSSAEQLLEMGDAVDAEKCRRLLAVAR